MIYPIKAKINSVAERMEFRCQRFIEKMSVFRIVLEPGSELLIPMRTYVFRQIRILCDWQETGLSLCNKPPPLTEQITI